MSYNALGSLSFGKFKYPPVASGKGMPNVVYGKMFELPWPISVWFRKLIKTIPFFIKLRRELFLIVSRFFLNVQLECRNYFFCNWIITSQGIGQAFDASLGGSTYNEMGLSSNVSLSCKKLSLNDSAAIIALQISIKIVTS